MRLAKQINLDLTRSSDFISCFSGVSTSISKLREFEKIGAVNTFKTASTD